jgi:murein L,D-transpeptidase YafK
VSRFHRYTPFFWATTLILTSLNSYAVDRVIVDKSERLMTLMDKGEAIRTYTISLGDNPKGHKQQEGDEKTPEGVYILDYVNEKSAYHRSMHVSYPNEQDIKAAEERGVSPGGFIMVHGQRNGLGWLSGATQKYDWTNGCIAITNDEMDEFLSLVPVGTPIEISW